mmetsp:Transcript_5795/g.10252  ORF Transcript_5795/g.10252 Transcript_5795/m.10252 type:complete len:192 (-) Transcript_5795:72-647(-)
MLSARISHCTYYLERKCVKCDSRIDAVWSWKVWNMKRIEELGFIGVGLSMSVLSNERSFVCVESNDVKKNVKENTRGSERHSRQVSVESELFQRRFERLPCIQAPTFALRRTFRDETGNTRPRICRLNASENPSSLHGSELKNAMLAIARYEMFLETMKESEKLFLQSDVYYETSSGSIACELFPTHSETA